MSSFVEVVTDSTCWHVRSDLADGVSLLLGPRGLRLDEWLAEGLAQSIKQARHRAIYRVILPRADFYLKHYPLCDRRGWFRQMIRASKARIEYDKAIEVAKRGIATVEPLALGEPHTKGRFALTPYRPGESYLLTRTLVQTHSLADYLETILPTLPLNEQPRMRCLLAHTLGHFLARMHNAGVAHHDLHPGNLLVRIEPEQEPQLYLVDLHAVAFGSPLSRRATRDNLGLFSNWFALRTERTDRHRFWRAYREARGGSLPHSPVGVMEKAIEEKTTALNSQRWKEHKQVCLGNARCFRTVRGKAATGHAVADLDADFLRQLADDPDALFHRPDTKLLKECITGTVAEVTIPGPAGERSVIYKRFHVKSRTDPWTSLVRPHAALRCYTLGHALRLRGVATPRPLCVLLRRRRGLVYEGYLMTEKVQEARDLHEYVNSVWGREDPRSTLIEVARLIRRLHDRGFSHRDLKAPNCLVGSAPVDSPAEGQPDNYTRRVERLLSSAAVWLIDLVGVRSHRKLSFARKVRNLSRLNASFVRDPRISRTDRLRFLFAYLGREARFVWKEWWRALADATARKVIKNQRSGRPLM